MNKFLSYEIVKLIGKGGMSEIYLVKRESDKLELALKIISSSLANSPDFSIRFQKEMAIMKKFIHPNIVKYYDSGEYNNVYYLAIEYLPGKDLKKRIIAKDIDVNKIVRWLKEISNGLDYAHRKGYMHRDIKPENILFKSNGTAVITDFGIAKAMNSGVKVTSTGMSIGTPYYMSPEQARGKNLDYRTDIYSVGVMLYEMLTGVVPYDGSDSIAIGIKHLTKPIPKLPVQYSHWQPILDKMMAKDRANRYSNLPEFIKDLDKIKNISIKQASENDIVVENKKQTIVTKTKVLNNLPGGKNKTVSSRYSNNKFSAGNRGKKFTRIKSKRTKLIKVFVFIFFLLALITGMYSFLMGGLNIKKLFSQVNNMLSDSSMIPKKESILVRPRNNTVKTNKPINNNKPQVRNKNSSLSETPKPKINNSNTTVLKNNSSTNIQKGQDSTNKIANINISQNQIKQYVQRILNNMVYISGGYFIMGSDRIPSSSPKKKISINGFYMSKYEITFAEYDFYASVTSANLPNSNGGPRGNYPVINVSWNDIKRYLGWLKSVSNLNFRLPTEAEWEYVARAGSNEIYTWGSDFRNNMSNCFNCGDRFKMTSPVGSFPPNRWGIYDMHGNVWEWTQDCWNNNLTKTPTNGLPATTGDCSNRVIRGGSWYDDKANIYVSKRERNRINSKTNFEGFRLALTR